jgi:hypothetical protein
MRSAAPSEAPKQEDQMQSNRGRSALRHVRSNAVSYLALFVALGGTSAYAADALPKASVGPKQLKRNAVTSAKVRDGSLRAGDFATGELPAGARGPAGERGPEGPRGETGAPGTSAFAGAIPSGTTISGYFAHQQPLATGKKLTFSVSFPVPAPSAPTEVNFSPSASDGEQDASCTGSNEAPTAPPGKVCLYSVAVSGAAPIEGATGGTRGFSIAMTASGGNPDFVGVRGTWAYTAP